MSRGSCGEGVERGEPDGRVAARVERDAVERVDDAVALSRATHPRSTATARLAHRGSVSCERVERDIHDAAGRRCLRAP